MSQKIDPYAWRLGWNEDYQVHWAPNLRDYADYSVKVARINQFMERYHRKVVRFDLTFKNLKEGTLNLKLVSIDDLRKGAMLQGIKRWASRRMGLKLSINAVFYDKREFDPHLVAEQVKSQIENRLNPAPMISHFIKLAESDPKIKGLRITIKGRWKAATKTKKLISQYGSTKVQSINTPVKYAVRPGVGKFGSFCVRVFLS